MKAILKSVSIILQVGLKLATWLTVIASVYLSLPEAKIRSRNHMDIAKCVAPDQ